jgi:hypothetical protein
VDGRDKPGHDEKEVNGSPPTKVPTCIQAGHNPSKSRRHLQKDQKQSSKRQSPAFPLSF